MRKVFQGLNPAYDKCLDVGIAQEGRKIIAY